MTSKRALQDIVASKNDTISSYNRTIYALEQTRQDLYRDRRDLLTILGKTDDDMPELRQAASALRYADEHEKQMAVAKDWTVTEP